jgi:hypothetical protein
MSVLTYATAPPPGSSCGPNREPEWLSFVGPAAFLQLAPRLRSPAPYRPRGFAHSTGSTDAGPTI